MAIIEEETSDSHPQSIKPDPSDHNSDGYETASDTELIEESENHSAGYTSSSLPSENQHEEQEENPNCNDSQVIEKALDQANVAKLEGNSLFKDGLYDEALSKYEFAIQIVPEEPSTAGIRSICYANRAACFSKLEKIEDTIKECTKALQLNPTYMKALVRRGEAHEKLEHFDESIADMTKILELDPSNDQARRSIIRLKPLADEKREKMKEEMIGKLKEMGNSILGRFGMSVDNFKAVKDPNTGSYSVAFQR